MVEEEDGVVVDLMVVFLWDGVVVVVVVEMMMLLVRLKFLFSLFLDDDLYGCFIKLSTYLPLNLSLLEII